MDYWPLAVTRALDDLILHLRTNEPEIGSWVLRTVGNTGQVLAYDSQLAALSDNWFVSEVNHYYKRTLKRLDVTSRSLFAVIEPGSCLRGAPVRAGPGCDRQYMLEGVYEDVDSDAEPAAIVLTGSNDGVFPMGNDLSRLRSRFGATTTTSTLPGSGSAKGSTLRRPSSSAWSRQPSMTSTSRTSCASPWRSARPCRRTP